MSQSFSQGLTRFRRYVVVGDLLGLFISFIGITLTVLLFHKISIPRTPTNIFLIFARPIIWIFSLTYVKAWQLRSLTSKRLLAFSVFKASWRVVAALAVAAYLLHSSISRILLIGQVLLGAVLLLIVRVALFNLVWKRIYPNLTEKNLIIESGTSPLDVDDIPPRLDSENANVFYEKICAPTAEDLDQWIAELKIRVKNEHFDGLIISPGAAAIPALVDALSKFYSQGITGIILKTKSASIISRFKAIPHPDWVAIEEPGITNNESVLKRLFDIFGSVVLIIISSPVLILTAIVVAINSPGPALYIADRVGQDQKLFRFPKFRSMYINADEKRLEILGRPDDQMVERYKRDPRITMVGRFIRRFSIDELPQLFCVLRGTMSLVGPRPILPEEYEQLRANDEYRFITKPGLTGLWQISGRKNVNWPERMALDIYYLENWNLGLDLFIILKTIRVIFSGEGAM